MINHYYDFNTIINKIIQMNKTCSPSYSMAKKHKKDYSQINPGKN
jgi:hypothetical protein